MSSERKAALIRGGFLICLLGLAAGAAIWFELPGFDWGARKGGGLVEQADPATIERLRKQRGCVVVLHAHEAGNSESEELQQILRELKQERYGDEVRMAEFNVGRHPEIAQQEGVSAETAPRLSFYIEGQRVGEFRGPWDKPPVQRKIDEILRGFLQRIGRNWRPPVPGMVPDRGQSNIEIRPAEQ